MIAHRPLRRNTLITALTACVEFPVRSQARRFLLGLSADELEFIAGFLGACILRTAEDTASTSRSLHPDRSGGRDHEHKMILLREFLHCSRRQRPAAA
jgi:hypothetical protein